MKLILIKKINIDLPRTLQEALNIAKKNNTDLIISKLDYQIAEKEANIEKARLSPSASINYSKSENKDFSSTVDEMRPRDCESDYNLANN